MGLRFPALLLSVAVALSDVSAGIPAPPDPPRLVNDFADIFDSYQNAKLEEMLVAFDDSTSNQITVVTVNDLEGYGASEYATMIGLSWGVGSEKSDNGIVVLVKPKNAGGPGETAIQVGYGLEGAIPDAYAKRIIENVMIPCFREGDYFQGVYEACEQLKALASGEISEPRDDGGEEAAAFILMAFIIFLIIIVIIAGRHRKGGSGPGGRTGSFRNIYFPGPGPGHGGSWGGGGSGGFGGFGGGSFGGGGASGKW